MAAFKDLALVMPIYNEEGCIEQVLRAWLRILEALRIDFEMILLNDGSTDGTAEVLRRFASDPRIILIEKTNSGHGPTILAGYPLASDHALWVFQTDSDDEISPESFPEFWRRRNDFDALFGIRTGRRQSAARILISFVSQAAAYYLFRSRIADVNVPYRLLRSSALKSALVLIPVHSFAPNILISGMFSLAGMRIQNLPVPHRNRHTGASSIARWRLWQGAIRSFTQLLAFRCMLAFRARQLKPH